MDSIEEKGLLDWARQVIMDQGDIAPMLFIDTRETNIAVMLADFGPALEDKMRIMFSAGVAVNKESMSCRKVTMVSTAWMVEVQGGKIPDIAPSKHPRRKEILHLVHSEGKARHEMKILTIERTPDGPVFMPNEMPRYDEIQSPLLDAFWAGINHGLTVL